MEFIISYILIAYDNKTIEEIINELFEVNQKREKVVVFRIRRKIKIPGAVFFPGKVQKIETPDLFSLYIKK